MKLTVNRDSVTPVYIQISDHIRRGIIDGSLVDGFLLPSERKLAEELGVHRNTVTRAYMELKGEGLIEARQGQGYRVHYHSLFEQMERRGMDERAGLRPAAGAGGIQGL